MSMHEWLYGPGFDLNIQRGLVPLFVRIDTVFGATEVPVDRDLNVSVISSRGRRVISLPTVVRILQTS